MTIDVGSRDIPHPGGITWAPLLLYHQKDEGGGEMSD